MFDMVVTLAVLKGTGWLKTIAPLNMPDMVLTLSVLKGTGWLNAFAD